MKRAGTFFLGRSGTLLLCQSHLRISGARVPAFGHALRVVGAEFRRSAHALPRFSGGFRDSGAPLRDSGGRGPGHSRPLPDLATRFRISASRLRGFAVVSPASRTRLPLRAPAARSAASALRLFAGGRRRSPRRLHIPGMQLPCRPVSLRRRAHRPHESFDMLPKIAMVGQISNNFSCVRPTPQPSSRLALRRDARGSGTRKRPFREDPQDFFRPISPFLTSFASDRRRISCPHRSTHAKPTSILRRAERLTTLAALADLHARETDAALKEILMDEIVEALKPDKECAFAGRAFGESAGAVG